MVKEVNNMENYTIRKKNTEISSPWEDITFWWLFFHAFLYTFMWKQKSLKKSCLTVCDPMDRTVHGILQARILEFLSPGDLPNPGMEPHCGRILYQSSHQGSPRILAWVAYPFSSRSSQPRNQTGVSCIVGRFFINWAMREAHPQFVHCKKTMMLLLWSGKARPRSFKPEPAFLPKRWKPPSQL